MILRHYRIIRNISRVNLTKIHWANGNTILRVHHTLVNGIDLGNRHYDFKSATRSFLLEYLSQAKDQLMDQEMFIDDS